MRWIEPEDVETGPAGPELSAVQRASWRERGFALVQGLFAPELLAEVADDARALFPPVGSKEAEAINDFGSSGLMHFPAESRSFNRLTLHPDFLRAVSSLLDAPVREIRLTQSELWPKYGRRERSGGAWDNDDQRMHCDYPNHTLTHPPPWEQPEAVEAILYYSDEESCGGATGLVAREGPEDPAYARPRVQMPGGGGLPWQNDRKSVEALLREQNPEVAAWRAAEGLPACADVRQGPGRNDCQYGALNWACREWMDSGLHVNLVRRRVPGLPDEQEYLFAPYSVFTVLSATWNAGTTAEPHVIELRAAVDNKEEPEDLPLAPWS